VDPELYAYLEESRRLTIESIRAEVGQLREDNGQRFAQLEGRIEGLREETGQRFTQLERRIDGLEGRIEEQGEGLREEIRHTRVLLESARDEIRLLGEGMMGLNETTAIFRGEVRGQLVEIRALITPLYQNLRERLETLEARAERQTRDVLDVIRERYGKPQAQ
jgi:hypothetical protein